MADRRSAGGKRLDGLIDSAFAFSATLLVVGKSGTMQSYSDLLASFANVPAFGLSMIVIISFWWAHRQYSLLVPRYDAASDAISLLILFVILIFVFPLSFLAEALTHWLSDGQLPGRGLTADETRNAYFVFGTGFCVLSGLYTALFGMALRTTNAARISHVMRPRVRDMVHNGRRRIAGDSQYLEYPAADMGALYPISVIAGLPAVQDDKAFYECVETTGRIWSAQSGIIRVPIP